MRTHGAAGEVMERLLHISTCFLREYKQRKSKNFGFSAVLQIASQAASATNRYFGVHTGRPDLGLVVVVLHVQLLSCDLTEMQRCTIPDLKSRSHIHTAFSLSISRPKQYICTSV